MKIKDLKPTQQILAFSMDDTRAVMRETFKAGVIDFLDKNSDNEVLLSTVANYCTKFELLYQTIEKDSLPKDQKESFLKDMGMIGCSDSLFGLGKQIKKIGMTQATTLVLGESGTGKELVAKALHQQSPRAKGPFVALNIGGEAASLLDSTLFGHRKGAFTGAIADQKGKFQLADKGTIFLDEIGDMSIDLQVKLLRVLQEREIYPVGSARPIPVDVRIIAATHKDLKKMVADGLFREDLFYRLSNIIITTTPLRDRPEDIEPLLAYFTEEICKENGFVRSFQKRCLEILKEYAWKGNVRELRSVVERHLVNSDSHTIRIEDLDASLYEKRVSSSPITLDAIDEHVEEVKKNLVIEVIKSTGSKAEASRKLGIAQNRLSYFITKWGLDKLGVFD